METAFIDCQINAHLYHLLNLQTTILYYHKACLEVCVEDEQGKSCRQVCAPILNDDPSDHPTVPIISNY